MHQLPIVEFANIEKRFGGVTALSGVDFSVHPGEVLGLVGENGAGKSTLLSILSGHHSPTSGTIRINGSEVRFAAPFESLATGIFVVRQEPTLYPDLTVAENLSIGRLPAIGRFLTQGRIIKDVERRLAAAGLSGLLPLSSLVKDLRPSDRQIVEIAKSVINAAPGSVVALDEPTSSLTAENVTVVMNIVRRLRDIGVAVIYVTHRMSELFEIADRFAVLRDGKVVANRPRSECTEPELIALMVGREIESMTRMAGRGDLQEVVLDVNRLCCPGLTDISFSLRAGEILGIGGLVKSGRTRLARTLFGDITATDGQVTVSGAAGHMSTPSEALRRGIVLVPEDRHHEGLVLQRSIRENLSLGRLREYSRMRVIDSARERAAAKELAARMRIKADSTEVEVGTLSGGNQQKVLLSRAIARNPRVLILDEPTRGVDVGAKAEIYELIRQRAAEGTAVLLISSELPELLLLSDRIAVMREGRMSDPVDGASATEESLLDLAMPEQHRRE